MLNSNYNPGLYIHVPFCGSKCDYCDFYSLTDQTWLLSWQEALIRETSLYQNCFDSFDTLYLGGGTPSILPDEILARLMDCIKKKFPFAPDTEMTIEANPNDLTPAKLELFRRLGFNRLSLGVQSWNDRILSFLNRRHNRRQAIQSLEWAKEAGFDNISLDLIYGIPGQSSKAWHENLEQALAFKPQHLSCYQLTFEPHTPLGRKWAQGRIQALRDDKASLFFLETSLQLAEAGYIHYEISNFAVDPNHVSKHNMKYWQHTPYLGLGPAAHSYQDNKRWWNVRNVEIYCRNLEQGRSPVEESEILTPDQWQLEALYLGFRTKQGVDLGLLKNYPNHQQIIGQLRESSLIQEQDGRIVPTRDGFLMADRLPLLFV